MELFSVEDDKVKLVLNPKMYDIEAVYSASYQMIEDTFIRFDGDPETEIVVYLSNQDETKNKSSDLSLLAKKFLNQLINYTYYKINSKNKEIMRTLLIKKSFESVNLSKINEVNSEKIISSEIENFKNEEEYDPKQSNTGSNLDDLDSDIDELITEDDLEFDDPDGIAIPWEEKFGEDKNLDKKSNEDSELDDLDLDDLEIPWDEDDIEDESNLKDNSNSKEAVKHDCSSCGGGCGN